MIGSIIEVDDGNNPRDSLSCVETPPEVAEA